MFKTNHLSNDHSTRPIRVLHTLGWVSSGGVEQIRLTLAKGLPKEHYQHMVITQEAVGGLPDLLRAEGWEIYEIGNAPHILSLCWYEKAYQIAKKFQPDIIHGAVFEGVALANVLGLRFPNAVIISEETSDPTDRSWRGNLLLRLLLMRSKYAIGVSPNTAHYLRTVANIPERKVKVINNAVPPAPEISLKKLAVLRDELGLKPEDFVIGSVGRIFDENKRFSDVIRGLKILHDQRIERIKLLIIGDGPDTILLKNLVQQLQLQDSVIFAGYKVDARIFYPLMDIFVLASSREAFGLVLVEAMLASIPVVATNVGGIPGVLNNGQAGVLVQPDSPQAISAAIKDLYEHPDKRKQLAKKGCEYAESNFSAERYCVEIDQLYRSVVTS